MDAATPPLSLPPRLAEAYQGLARDLQAVFGPRLRAVVAFGPGVRAAGDRSLSPTTAGDALALVDRVMMDDLTACGGHAGRWHDQGLRMPLLLGHDEFVRSLDAFPLEYDDIIAHHIRIAGDDPFTGVAVRPEDLRRACEARAKGHLVHLREGYLETRRRPADIANLILASVAPFSALLGNLARLQGLPSRTPAERAAAIAGIPRVSAAVVGRVLDLEWHPLLPADEAAKLYPDYLAAVEELVAWVDTWSRS